MAKLFGRLNNLSYRGGETETANVVIDGGVIKVDVVGSPQDVTGAYIIDNKVYITRANASPLEMALPLPQPDLAETNTESLAFVKNKKISYLENDKDYITTRGANKAYIKKVTVNNVEVPILDNDIEQVAQLLVGEGLSVGVNATVSVDTSKIATNKYVDSNTAVVTENITQHKNDYNNPHKVTKAQVGLDKVDNTADIDKPISTATKTALDTLQSGIEAHIEDGNNPHQVTAEQVGLGNVNNTSDMDKPVSTLQQQALDTKVDKVEGKGLSTEDFTTELKGKLDGIENGAQVNTITGVKGAAESEYRVGNVNITKGNIGLENVDNTSDVNKPISTAQQQALDTKTNVTVNGEHVATFDADTKLDKVSGSDNAYKIYGTDNNGNNIRWNLTYFPQVSGGTIPVFNSNRTITVDPAYNFSALKDSDAVNKKYVDDLATTKQDALTGSNPIYIDSNNNIGLNYGNGLTVNDSILELSSNILDSGFYASNDSYIKNDSNTLNIITYGNLEIDSASETGEIRVQGAYNSETGKATTIKVHNSVYGLSINTSNIELGAASTDGTITPYLTIGPENQVLVDTPTVDKQVANKKYVDDGLANKQNKLNAIDPIYTNDDGTIGLNLGGGLYVNTSSSNSLDVDWSRIPIDSSSPLYFDSCNNTGLNISASSPLYANSVNLGINYGHGLNKISVTDSNGEVTATVLGVDCDSSSPLYIDGNNKLSLKCSNPLYIDTSNDNKLSVNISEIASNIAGDGLTYSSSTTKLVVDFNELASNIKGDGLWYNSSNHTINSDFNAIASNITYTKKLAEASTIDIDSSKLITLMAEPSNSISFANVSWVELTVTQTADSTYTGWGVQYESSSGSVPESFTYKVVSNSTSSNVSASSGTIVTTTIIR